MQVSHQETGDSSTVAVAVTAASTASSHIHIEEQRRRSLSVISFSEHHQSAAASNAASSTTPSSTFSSSKKTTPKVRFFQPILDIGSFFTSSHRHFSPFFLLIIAITYFLQGFRNYALGDAILFYFHRFHPNSVQGRQTDQAIVLVSWNIKFVYGLIYDNFPIFKRHDKPYMILSAIFQIFGFFFLGPFTPASDGESGSIFFYFVALLGMAFSDVVVDAMMVKQARAAGQKGGADLQSFCWIMMSVGNMVGRPLGGLYIQNGENARQLFGYVYTSTSGIALISSILLIREPLSTTSSINASFARLWHHIKMNVMGILGNSKVFLPVCWMFVVGAIVPDVTGAMLSWKIDVINFGSYGQANVEAVGEVFAILGLLIYAKWFKRTPFRTIFFWTQLVLALSIIFDIVVVNQWTLKINLDPILFIWITSMLMQVVKMLQIMPFLVMAAQLCPMDMEASFYAAIVAIHNIGFNVAVRWGGALCNAYNITTTVKDRTQLTLPRDDGSNNSFDYSGLPMVLNIRLILSLIPCLLVWFMVPNTFVVDSASMGEAGSMSNSSNSSSSSIISSIGGGEADKYDEFSKRKVSCLFDDTPHLHPITTATTPTTSKSEFFTKMLASTPSPPSSTAIDVRYPPQSFKDTPLQQRQHGDDHQALAFPKAMSL